MSSHLHPTEQPITFLNAREAAMWLRVSPITLGRWRIEGCGPPFRKFGRRVVYARADLLSWAEAQKRSSTSEV
jgi:Helix-turn-helix domain